MNVVGFADGDWAIDLDERRLTSGKCIFAGGKLVSWSSKKQATLSRLSMKAERPTLSNINLDIPIGSLIAVVSSIGKEKTSLVSAMLGELPPIADATVTIKGKVAYVPQVSWIFNATVRDNILFGMSFE